MWWSIILGIPEMLGSYGFGVAASESSQVFPARITCAIDLAISERLFYARQRDAWQHPMGICGEKLGVLYSECVWRSCFVIYAERPSSVLLQ